MNVVTEIPWAKHTKATGIQPHINKISRVYKEHLPAERWVFVVNGCPEAYLAKELQTSIVFKYCDLNGTLCELRSLLKPHLVMFYTRPDHQGCTQCQFTVVQDRHSGVKFLLEFLQHYNLYMEGNLLSGNITFSNTKNGILLAQGAYFLLHL